MAGLSLEDTVFVSKSSQPALASVSERRPCGPSSPASDSLTPGSARPIQAAKYSAQVEGAEPPYPTRAVVMLDAGSASSSNKCATISRQPVSLVQCRSATRHPRARKERRKLSAPPALGTAEESKTILSATGNNESKTRSWKACGPRHHSTRGRSGTFRGTSRRAASSMLAESARISTPSEQICWVLPKGFQHSAKTRASSSEPYRAFSTMARE